MSICTFHETSCTVLDVLQSFSEVRWRSCKQVIAVVDVAHDIGVNKLSGGVFGDEIPDLADHVEVEE